MNEILQAKHRRMTRATRNKLTSTTSAAVTSKTPMPASIPASWCSARQCRRRSNATSWKASIRWRRAARWTTALPASISAACTSPVCWKKTNWTVRRRHRRNPATTSSRRTWRRLLSMRRGLASYRWVLCRQGSELCWIWFLTVDALIVNWHIWFYQF